MPFAMVTFRGFVPFEFEIAAVGAALAGVDPGIAREPEVRVEFRGGEFFIEEHLAPPVCGARSGSGLRPLKEGFAVLLQAASTSAAIAVATRCLMYFVSARPHAIGTVRRPKHLLLAIVGESMPYNRLILGHRDLRVLVAGDRSRASASAADVLSTEVLLNNAILAHDAATAGQYLTDDYTLTLASGKVLDRAALLAIVADRSVTLTTNRSHDEHVRMYGDATAIVTGIVEEAGTQNGSPFDIQCRLRIRGFCRTASGSRLPVTLRLRLRS